MMYHVDTCPCCGSQDTTSYAATIAPFVAHYVLATSPGRCSLLECQECSFRFFDARYTAEEVAKLYANYRGEHYFRARHRYEFWYTQGLNTGIGHDAEQLTTRTRLIQSLIEQHADLESIDSVLDYGGDEGQFIPAAVGKHKFVFELSSAEPVPGVTKIGCEAELDGRRFDLLMACGVLEHASDPREMVTHFQRLAPGGLCYLAVPYERYDLRFAGRGWLYEQYLSTLLRFEPALIAVDFYSTAIRTKTNWIPPLGVMKCHEHLNYFNEPSLKALLRRAGFEILACTTAGHPSYLASGTILHALARVPSVPS